MAVRNICRHLAGLRAPYGSALSRRQGRPKVAEPPVPLRGRPILTGVTQVPTVPAGKGLVGRWRRQPTHPTSAVRTGEPALGLADRAGGHEHAQVEESALTGGPRHDQPDDVLVLGQRTGGKPEPLELAAYDRALLDEQRSRSTVRASDRRHRSLIPSCLNRSAGASPRSLGDEHCRAWRPCKLANFSIPWAPITGVDLE